MGVQTNPPLAPSQVRRFVSEKTQGAGDALEQAWSDVLPRIERFCREQPLAAIGIGVAVGVALRSLLSRSRAG